MAENNSANEAAKKSIAEERAKLGLPPRGAKPSEDDRKELGDDEPEEEPAGDEPEPKPDPKEDEDEEEGEDDTDEDSDDEDDEDEDEEDDADDEDPKSRKLPKKVLAKEKAKRLKLKEKNKELKKQLADALKSKVELESKIPKDLEKEIQDLATEIGVDDPESLDKFVQFVKKNIGKDVEELRKKLQELTEDKQVENETKKFTSDWNQVLPKFKKEFPNATDEQLAAAQKLMDKLAHTPGIGGRVTKDANGNDVIEGYPLSYILFEQREKFEALVTTKKQKGMEKSSTQGIIKTDNSGKPAKLPKNASAEQIRERDKQMAKIEAERDELRAPVDQTL